MEIKNKIIFAQAIHWPCLNVACKLEVVSSPSKMVKNIFTLMESLRQGVFNGILVYSLRLWKFEKLKYASRNNAIRSCCI